MKNCYAKHVGILGIAVVCASAMASTCRAETAPIEPAAQTLMDETAARYRALGSYADVMSLSASGSEEILGTSVGEMNFTAEIQWQKPNKARIVKRITNGNALGVSDGQTLWAFTPKHADYYLKRAATDHAIGDAMNEIDVGAPGLGIIADGYDVAEMQKLGLTSLKMGEIATVDGVRVQRVVADFKFATEGSALTTFEIGVADGLLHRVTQQYVSDKGRATIVETHAKIELNPQLPATIFTFPVPPKLEAIDYYFKLGK